MLQCIVVRHIPTFLTPKLFPLHLRSLLPRLHAGTVFLRFKRTVPLAAPHLLGFRPCRRLASADTPPTMTHGSVSPVSVGSGTSRRRRAAEVPRAEQRDGEADRPRPRLLLREAPTAAAAAAADARVGEAGRGASSGWMVTRPPGRVMSVSTRLRTEEERRRAQDVQVVYSRSG